MSFQGLAIDGPHYGRIVEGEQKTFFIKTLAHNGLRSENLAENNGCKTIEYWHYVFHGVGIWTTQSPDIVSAEYIVQALAREFRPVWRVIE